MSLDCYRLQRGLSSGRRFNYFACKRFTETLTYSSYFDSSDQPYGVFKEDGFSVPLDLFQLRDAKLTIQDLLFVNSKPLIEEAKFPDQFRYFVSVPVYFGVRLQVKRFYLVLNTLARDLPDNLHYAVNNEAGIGGDFAYWFDAQGSSVMGNVASGLTGPALADFFWQDGRFKQIAHHPMKMFDINCGVQLPNCFEYLAKPYSAFTNTIANFVSEFYNLNVSDNSVNLGSSAISTPYPSLNVSVRMPYQDDTFVKLLKNNALAINVDYDMTVKLSFASSYRMPFLFAWKDASGNKIPTDL